MTKKELSQKPWRRRILAPAPNSERRRSRPFLRPPCPADVNPNPRARHPTPPVARISTELGELLNKDFGSLATSARKRVVASLGVEREALPTEKRPQIRREVEDWASRQRDRDTSDWAPKQRSHLDRADRHDLRNSVAILRNAGRLRPNVSLKGDAEVVDSSH
jgi:hypothetical protein